MNLHYFWEDFTIRMFLFFLKILVILFHNFGLKVAENFNFHEIVFNVFLSVNEGIQMVLRVQEKCLKHPMTIVNAFWGKFFEFKSGRSQILQKTVFFDEITMPGVSKILGAELTPMSF